MGHNNNGNKIRKSPRSEYLLCGPHFPHTCYARKSLRLGKRGPLITCTASKWGLETGHGSSCKTWRGGDSVCSCVFLTENPSASPNRHAHTCGSAGCHPAMWRSRGLLWHRGGPQMHLPLRWASAECLQPPSAPFLSMCSVSFNQKRSVIKMVR